MCRPRSPRCAHASAYRWCVRCTAVRAVSKTTPENRPVGGSMKYEGLWHITAMEMWDADYLHMEVHAFIRITRAGGGEFQFGLVSGQIDGELVKTAAGERFEFTWEGNDECDPAS